MASPTNENADVAQNADRFPAGARRIQIFMICLSFLLVAVVSQLAGRATALGLACGCAVAGLNFFWLKNGVTALADTASGTRVRPIARSIWRFLMRYALIALTSYVILNGYPKALRGFLGGLFLPVAAIALELVYELAQELRTRIS